jgi:hypothetical protein
MARAVEMIEALVQIPGLRVRVACTVTKLNLSGVGEFVRQLDSAERRLDALVVQPIINMGRATRSVGMMLSPEEVVALGRDIHEVAESCSTPIVYLADPFEQMRENLATQTPLSEVHITRNGNVTPFSLMGEVLGNVREHSLERIWVSNLDYWARPAATRHSFPRPLPELATHNTQSGELSLDDTPAVQAKWSDEGIAHLPDGSMIELNDTSVFIVRKCDGQRTIREIARELASAYEGVTQAIAERDVLEFVAMIIPGHTAAQTRNPASSSKRSTRARRMPP